MSRAPWTRGLTVCAAIPSWLPSLPSTTSSASSSASSPRSHEGQDDTLPELHQARGIAHVARTLQSQIDAYRRLLAAPPKAAAQNKGRSPGRT